MNQFVLRQGHSRELQLFPHIIEFAAKKNLSIQLDSLRDSSADYIRIYYINDGKFEWCIHHKQYLLYPGDMAIVLPGQMFGGTHGFLEIGMLSWLHLNINRLPNGKMDFGNWSGLSDNEKQTIGKILLLNKSVVLSRLTEANRIFLSLQHELFNHEIGYFTRVGQLLDELFINITRHLAKQTNPGRDFPKIFLQLEQKLRENLSHQWTVEEMAATMGIGTTLFNEKVKNYSGFSPLNYLINIRISEAIKLLKKPDIHVTTIALDTGFYSSQHFSTTFKKLTGYTPSEFRKKTLSES
jgi:AraC-like DNA-binding protein